MWEICNGNETRAQTFKLQELPWLKGKQTDYRAENVYTLLQDLKGHCLIFLSAIYQLFIEYFNIK